MSAPKRISRRRAAGENAIDAVVLCPPGFEDVVAEAAGRDLPRCVESMTAGGFVRLRTEASVQQLRAFPCATNVFAVLTEVPRTSVDHEAHGLRERLATAVPPLDLAGRGRAGGAMRLRIHDDGRFVATTSRAVAALEEALRSWSEPS